VLNNTNPLRITDPISLFEQFLPEFLFLSGTLLLLVYVSFTVAPFSASPHKILSLLALGLTAGTVVLVIRVLTINSHLKIFYLDFSALLRFVILLSTFYFFLAAENRVSQAAEFSLLSLLFIVGVVLLLISSDFILLYIGVEIQSIVFYVLSCVGKKSSFSAEIGLKYFVLGALTSCLFLFGCSFVYGATGTVDFQELLVLFAGTEEHPLAIFGSLCILMALFFKLSVAPFHVWSPDVYEGAPSVATALFSIAAKLGPFAIVVKFFYNIFYDSCILTYCWSAVGLGCGLLSVFVGSIAVLGQNRIKRLLAFSSICHVGYVLVGLFSHNSVGVQAVLLYLIAYTLANVCVWGVLLSARKIRFLSELRILYFVNPALCFSLSLGLLSLASLPPLLGFIPKFLIFVAAVHSSLFFVTIFSIFLSVSSTFYYLNLVKILLLENNFLWEHKLWVDYSSKLNTVIICVASTSLVILSFFPSPMVLFTYYLSLLVR